MKDTSQSLDALSRLSALSSDADREAPAETSLFSDRLPLTVMQTYATHLRSLAAALTSEVTAEEAAEAVLQLGVAAMGANAGSVALFSPDGTELITLHCLGYSPETAAKYQRYSIDTLLPNADVARTGQALYISTLQQRNSRYPYLAPNKVTGGRGATAALPLVANARILGGVAWSFPTDRLFTEDERTFLETITSLCALAMERVQSQIRFKALFDHSSDAIGIAANGRIWYVNQALATMLGYAAPEELISLSTMDVVAPSDRPRLMEIGRRRILGAFEPTTYEYRGIRKDGTEIDVENRVTFYTEGGERYTLVISRNVTARNKRMRGQRFLTEASLVLSSSLDVDTTLNTVAQLAVPHLADWCVIHLADAAGLLQPVAVSHIDPLKVAMAREVNKRYPPDPQSPGGVYAVLQSGQSECISPISETMIRAAARDEEHLRILLDVGMQAYMCVPLVARDQRLGTITFLSAESGLRFSDEDVALAEDLGRRAGLAVENARLFQAEQQARQAMETLNTRLQQAMTETHHRVKNNLQVIASMIDMHMADGQSGDTLDTFRKLSTSIRTLAALHDLLTQQAKVDSTADRVSSREVLQKVLAVHQMAVGSRLLRLNAEDHFLPTRLATGLALVFNELLTNAVKHGTGEVATELTHAADTAQLEVCDDGAGFPEEFGATESETSGLELVETIVRWDLKGNITYSNRAGGGAKVVVTFPVS